MKNKKLIIIGGGAAGFFCAVNTARLNPSLSVLILEKTSRLLSKVKVSGGGRCNVTHACDSITEMLAHYPRGASFLKKAFHHFFTKDTINWFESRKVLLKAEADGRMFPVSNDSQTIIDCLLREANNYGVEIMMNAAVESITKRLPVNEVQEMVAEPVRDESGNEGFLLQLNNNRQLFADYVCVACGGYSKSAQFNWLVNLGHTIERPVPSLFTFNIPGDPIRELMGVSVDNAVVKINGTKLSQQGALLITHWGLSGPAILKLSAWGARILEEKNYACSVQVNWLPGFNENSLREKMQMVRFDIATQKIYNRNPFGLPARLWEYFLRQCGVKEELRWADLPAKEQNKLIKILCAGEFFVKGKTTFKEEFVTAGGIKVSEIDSNTMQSKIVPGLFFAGEIMDVDGVTGGFNFQHAWTSGYIAATGITALEHIVSKPNN